MRHPKPSSNIQLGFIRHLLPCSMTSIPCSSFCMAARKLIPKSRTLATWSRRLKPTASWSLFPLSAASCSVPRRCWDYDRANDTKGHIAELVKLANTLKARSALNIDQNHVYIVGLSSGAAMALAVGCKAPDVFAGIGAIAGPSVGSSQSDALDDALGRPFQQRLHCHRKVQISCRQQCISLCYANS